MYGGYYPQPWMGGPSAYVPPRSFTAPPAGGLSQEPLLALHHAVIDQVFFSDPMANGQG